MEPGVIIVSNRLPVSVKRVAGKLELYPSVGGLATGLATYTKDHHNKWIGWPGIASDDLSDTDKQYIAQALLAHNCYPVFLSKAQISGYYNGYSNSVLWPLMHEMPSHHTRHNHWWRAYKDANEVFAAAVLALSEPDSTIWVHDYQLMLLPAMIRAKRPTATIGFFLHVPFPDGRYLHALTGTKALLRGVLGADLVGFHTTSYTDNFLAACREHNIGLVTGRQVATAGRVTRVAELPISIDYAKFAKAARLRGVQQAIHLLKRRYRGQRIILTVDRLDPTKGLLERLKAYEQFLRRSPQRLGKVVMVMLATPSRTEVAEYKQLKAKLERRIHIINKEFATAKWQPVDYLHTTLSFEELAALYRVADVAFIAPIRDGMNLVAKEYVASQIGQAGSLILSATAGAAEELTEALIVDPKRPDTLVEALMQAFTMPQHELRHRLSRMQKHLETHTIQHWASAFITLLQQPAKSITHTKPLTIARQHEITAAFHEARKRLLLLDYDGVLAPIVKHYADAKPSQSLKKILTDLINRPNTETVLITGRSRHNMDEWFGGLPIAIAAEHGAILRMAGHKRWHRTSRAKPTWQKSIRPILEDYAAKTPGAHVEVKDYSLVWHYRQAAPYQAHKNLAQLKHALHSFTQAHNLELRDGLKILEVRPHGIDKGQAASYWLRDDLDFIIAIGDDQTDEDMFAILPDTAYTMKVGRGHTLANFRLPDTTGVLTLLKDFIR